MGDQARVAGTRCTGIGEAWSQIVFLFSFLSSPLHPFQQISSFSLFVSLSLSLPVDTISICHINIPLSDYILLVYLQQALDSVDAIQDLGII